MSPEPPSQRAALETQPASKKKIASTFDLARHLNLSQWTVSRAINGHEEVNIATRRRVMEAMEGLGFAPNPLARGLAKGGTGFIGICISDLASPILNTKIVHMQRFLRDRRLRGLLEFTDHDAHDEQRIINDFRRIGVEGIVMVNTQLTAETVTRLMESTPCVHVDPRLPQSLPSVSLDRESAMNQLFGHLWDKGHRRFCLLGISKDDRWRYAPLLKAARRRRVDANIIFHCFPDSNPGETSIRAGYTTALAALATCPEATAYITRDDLLAVGAINALREAGVRVPEHISVTGFDNLDLARHLRPSVTTIEQHPRRMMEAAGELLLQERALPAEQRGRYLRKTTPPELVVGESTGPVRSD